MSTSLPIRAFQWDLARQVERLDVLIGLLPKYADWGYQELYLHLEDAVEFPSLPEVARTDAYSQSQMGTLVAAAERAGIKVVPIVNLLGHTQYLIKTPSLRDLNELRAPDGTPLEQGQICPLHPRLAEVAEKLLRDTAAYCTAGKVHVGLDESFHLGKCPACRDEIARLGLGGHFAKHVGHLRNLTRSLGLRMGIWADMLAFVPEAIPQLPEDLIAYDWYYYPFAKRPKVEFFNFAEIDLATPLQARGIEYWGCPMNGAFRFEPLPLFQDRLANLRSWWKRCRSTGAAGFLVTSWEAYRLALEMTTVVDAAAAELWLNPTGDHRDVAMLTQGFKRVFGRSGAASAARIALAADRYPFAGYARWESNQRWDGAARENAPQAKAEARLFRRLCRKTAPAPLQASLSLRSYLADRDVFIQSCLKGVATLRRAAVRSPEHTAKSRARVVLLQKEADDFGTQIANGRKAARAMWRRSRDPNIKGQNEIVLEADSQRLHLWRIWLRKVARRLPDARESSPALGKWQLQFTVINFAPAVQRVVVLRQNSQGEWIELGGRHTIEFQAFAARKRTNLRRPFALPVESADDVLAISLRGVGEVVLANIVLTDGVTKLRCANATKHTRLGRPAPQKGFPDVHRIPGESEILRLNFRPRRG